MGLETGIGVHGAWSISRDLTRGLDSRTDDKRMMELAHTPRQGRHCGRGSLRLAASPRVATRRGTPCHDSSREATRRQAKVEPGPGIHRDFARQSREFVDVSFRYVPKPV